jgi:hypothetical protein
MPDALTYILDAITKPAQSRTERYMARVESHLAGLPEAERAPFIGGQIEAWRDRYASWAARIDAGTATPTDLKCDAYDFVFTLAALGKKARELAGEKADA